MWRWLHKKCREEINERWRSCNWQRERWEKLEAEYRKISIQVLYGLARRIKDTIEKEPSSFDDELNTYLFIREAISRSGINDSSFEAIWVDAFIHSGLWDLVWQDETLDRAKMVCKILAKSKNGLWWAAFGYVSDAYWARDPREFGLDPEIVVPKLKAEDLHKNPYNEYMRNFITTAPFASEKDFLLFRIEHESAVVIMEEYRSENTFDIFSPKRAQKIIKRLGEIGIDDEDKARINSALRKHLDKLEKYRLYMEETTRELIAQIGHELVPQIGYEDANARLRTIEKILKQAKEMFPEAASRE